MSFFGKIFGGGGGGSKEKLPTTLDAIQKLSEIEEILNKKQAYIEKKVEEEVAIIKENGTKNKRVSLAALKRKKRLEKQLEQIEETLVTIQIQREALENAGTNAEVMKAISYAAKAMKAAHNNMDMNQVDDLMDEVKEQQQIAEEISNAFSSYQDFDEDEIMKELEEIEREDMQQKELENIVKTDSPTRNILLPDVPLSPLEPAASTSKSKKTIEEEDLAELAQWAN